MIDLRDNRYNRDLPRGRPQFRVWRYAGLMLSYRCNASCRFCYYHCRPDAGGLMGVEIAIGAWESLRRLAGNQARVHLTGGEPFLFFDRLSEIVLEAHRAGLTPIESIETNGGWATDESIIRERIEFLDRHGMDKLKISWDPFHAEFVDAQTIRRLVDTAREMLGTPRVLVRWEPYLLESIDIQAFEGHNRHSVFQKTVTEHPIRFTGRAAGDLAEGFASASTDELASSRCLDSFLSAKGVHVDPFGNVFSGLCSGIVLGNIQHEGLDEMWKRFDPIGQDLVGRLCREGPCGLLPEAIAEGYSPRPLYAGKCHLCTHLRQFFFDKGRDWSIIGPSDCYEQSR